MMENFIKDFDGWNNKKKDINAKENVGFYRPRDVWKCSFGVNIGTEEDGTGTDFQRPVLILREFGGKMCLIVPLTRSNKAHKYRIDVGLVAGQLAKVILSQIRVIDTKRLVEKIAVLDEDLFKFITKSIKDLL